MFKLKKKGIILIYIFIFMISIGSIITFLFHNHLSDMRLYNDYENEVKASWLSYGGIAFGYNKLANNPNFSGSLTNKDIKSYNVSVIIKDDEKKKKIVSISNVSKVKIKSEKEFPPIS